MIKRKDSRRTLRREIIKLLSQLDDEFKLQAINLLRDFTARLRSLAKKPVTRSTGRKGGQGESIASQTFGMMPADAAIVRQALSEDLYELE